MFSSDAEERFVLLCDVLVRSRENSYGSVVFINIRYNVLKHSSECTDTILNVSLPILHGGSQGW